jgi:heme exporter protein B
MSWFKQVWAVFSKDMLIEWRSPTRLSGLFFFALALLLLVAYTNGGDSFLLPQIAGATLWIGLLLASTRALDQSWGIEVEHGALEGLVLWPVSASALFYGKALANTVVLFLVLLALCPLTMAIYDVSISGQYDLFFGLLVFGCSAIAAPGTLYGAITVRARGSSALLPLLLFPLIVPALMASAEGVSAIFGGDVLEEAPLWFGLLLMFNAIHWGLSGWLFRYVVEDT